MNEGPGTPPVPRMLTVAGGLVPILIVVVAAILPRLVSLRSDVHPVWDDRVLLVDTMGELENFFELADLVFLGGSLTPVGGHNVLEPAASACPVIVGPHIETCRREAEILAAAGGLEVLSDENAFVAAVARLLSDASERERMGRAARQALLGLQGATEANLHLLRSQGLLRGSALDRSGECSTLSRPSSAPMVDPEGHNTTYMRVGSSAGLSNGSPAGLSLSPRSGVHLP